MWVEECKSESTCIIKIVNKKAPHLFCLRIANIYNKDYNNPKKIIRWK